MKAPRAIVAAAAVSLAAPQGSVTAATYPITYRLAQAGNLSLAIYRPDDTIVRELLRATPRPAGEQTTIWDGLDRDGKAVPAGKYRWRLLETQGLSARYLLSVGSNYPIGTDLSSSGGPGTHVSPYAVAADPTGIYISALQTENIESCVIKLSPDGKRRLWSQRLPEGANRHIEAWEGARALAISGKELFLLGKNDPQKIYVSDAAAGVGLRHFDVHWDPAAPDFGTDELAHGASDMDARAGTVVVAYRAKNAVRWYSGATGALLDTATVAAPAGVVIGDNGVAYVTTGDRVVSITRGGHKIITVAKGLISPGRLDIDRLNGTFLVFQGGPRQQVVRLSPTGALLRTYGAAGGRQDGLYVDRNFAGLTDLSADGNGGFFVAEPFSAPRRVAHLMSDGHVAQEWYGGQPWDTHGAFEPEHPDVMWVASATSQGNRIRYVMRVIIDYATRSWRVHSCYKYVSPANPTTHTSANEGNLFHIYRHGAVNYLAIEGFPCIFKIDQQRWRLIPVTSFGGGFQWNDANGDGLIQEQEKIFYSKTGPRAFHVSHVDARLDFYFVRGFGSSCQIRRYLVDHWNAEGAPVYGNVPEGQFYADCPARFIADPIVDPRWGAFLHHDVDSGALYAALNPGTISWCQSADSFVQKWAPDGRLAWGVGELGPASTTARLATYAKTDPGFIYWNLRGIAGVTHGALVATDVDGGWMTERAQTYVWDRDGLFVGGIMDHPDLNGVPEFMYHCGGEFAHSAVTTTAAGEVFFAGNWESDVRIYKVTGWDDPATPWVRAEGSLQVDVPSRNLTGQGLAAASFSDPGFSQPRAVRVDDRIDFDARRRSALGGGGVRWQGALTPSYGPAYTGPWIRMPDGAASAGGYHRTVNNGARVACRFHGRSVEIRAIKDSDCGYMNVYLDGTKVAADVDLYSPQVARDATVFQRTGLRPGDHLITVEALGQHGPRNRLAKDGAVAIDRFVVDGVNIEDDGLPYLFYLKSNGRDQLWIDGKPVISDWIAKQRVTEAASPPIKLERKLNPVQLSYLNQGRDARLSLSWSSPLDPKSTVPASALFPTVTGAALAEPAAAPKP